jgi:hypothetical protein
MVVVALTACTSEKDPGDVDTPRTSAVTRTPAPVPPPTSLRKQVREVLRDRSPDADGVIDLAGAPAAWVKGQDRLLLEYRLMPPSAWPYGQNTVAVQLLDRHGTVRGEAVQRPTSAYQAYYPAGQGFVGLSLVDSTATSAILIRDDGVAPLTTIEKARVAAPGDLRVGPGFLLDRNAMTITPELLEGCERETIRTDLERRVWCLDEEKETVSWSDDGGASWTRHRLSTSYFSYCDGGSTGADLDLQDEAVAIGLWGADFSPDRGTTWHAVELPFELVGAQRTGTSFPNCTITSTLSDGRLVIEYFGAAVAHDATNTEFSRIHTPAKTQYAGLSEGILTAASTQAYGTRVVSYDGGRTWQPVFIGDLVKHTLRPAN